MERDSARSLDLSKKGLATKILITDLLRQRREMQTASKLLTLSDVGHPMSV